MYKYVCYDGQRLHQSWWPSDVRDPLQSGQPYVQVFLRKWGSLHQVGVNVRIIIELGTRWVLWSIRAYVYESPNDSLPRYQVYYRVRTGNENRGCLFRIRGKAFSFCFTRLGSHGQIEKDWWSRLCESTTQMDKRIGTWRSKNDINCMWRCECIISWFQVCLASRGV